jgi:hypothetical protein
MSAETGNIKGIRIHGLKEQQYLRRERTPGRIFGKTIGLEIAKRIAGSSVGFRTIRDWTLWRGRPPTKEKKSLLAALA